MAVDKSQPNAQPKVQQIKSDIRARMLGAHTRFVKNGNGEAHVFLLTHAPWAEPIGSVYSKETLSLILAL